MNKIADPLRLVISGGGTGGHIYPALAIADAVKTYQPEADILFVGAKGRMEMEKVPQAGYPIEGLWISGLQRRLTAKNLLFPLKILASLKKSREIIRRFKPQVAVGVGGYASGPLLKMAEIHRIPTLLQEQNGYAGLTNKWLAKKASKICVAYPNMGRFFPEDKIVFTGNPVRNDLLDLHKIREKALKNYGFTAERPILFVFGGSLGARTLNQTMLAHVSHLHEKGIQVIWQTGKANFKPIHRELEANFSLLQGGVVLLPFIDKMAYAYAAADLVVARAGALSISELALAQKASILVPSPHVAEDHQTKNAKALADKNAAVLVSDADAPQKLVPKVIEILENPQQKIALQTRIATFAKPEAARDIAKEIFKLSGKYCVTKVD